MNAKSIASALLSALLLLPAGIAEAQSIGPSANHSNGGAPGGSGENSLSAALLEPATHLRPPRHLRKNGECERKIKTVNVDGVIYVAVFDCNDRPL